MEQTWYADTDGDGFGVDDDTIISCEQPEGYAAVSGDNCPDIANADQADFDNDGLGDVCDDDADDDGVLSDEDCNDLDPSVGADGQTWYADADEDGFGIEETTVVACAQPEGYAAEPGDCDDGDASVYPGAPEIANDGIDQDCDGEDLVVDSPISSLTLVNSMTDADIRELGTNSTVDVSVDGANLNIRANTNTAVGSVVFTIDGNNFRTENVAPYALAGADAGDYRNWNFNVPDVVEVCAIPYSGPKGTGEAGEPFCVTITIIENTGPSNEPPVIMLPATDDINYWGEAISLQVKAMDPDMDQLTYSATGFPPSLSIDPNTGLISGVLDLENEFGSSTGFTANIQVSDGQLIDDGDIEFFILHPGVDSFTLIDTDTDAPVPGFDPMPDGTTLDLTTLPANLSIRANTSIPEVNGGAVIFTVNGSKARTENVAPYALKGDKPVGDYDPYNFVPGSYTLAAGIYSGFSGSGGFSFNGDLTINFTVVNGLPPAMNPGDMNRGDVTAFEAMAYPNPFSDQTTIRIASPEQMKAHIVVYNMTGRLVMEETRTINPGHSEQTINLSGEAEGAYLVRIINEKGDVQGNVRIMKK